MPELLIERSEDVLVGHPRSLGPVRLAGLVSVEQRVANTNPLILRERLNSPRRHGELAATLKGHASWHRNLGQDMLPKGYEHLFAGEVGRHAEVDERYALAALFII